jgi:peptidoglycan/LPS O-acetylase OafA/YrhL
MHKQKQHLPTLDGWRGLSVIGVILFHGHFFSNHVLKALSFQGGCGVAVFFAISGFLICHLLLEEHERAGTINLARFYLRRCFRIMPAYYIALLGLALVAASRAIQLNGSELPSSLLFYRSYMPLGSDEAGGWYTAHFWSLTVEAHFYLLWPLVVALVSRWAGEVTFLLSMAVLGWRLLDPHVMADTRMDGLFWGCLAAIYFDPLARWVERIPFTQLWMPVAALVIASMRLPCSPAWHIGFENILLPALILTTVLQPASWLSRALEWKPIAWMGTISYSVYLCQQLFLPQDDPARGALHSVQQPPWNVLAILLCGILSYCLIEMPMIRWGHRVTSHREVFPTHTVRYLFHKRGPV